MNNILPSQIEDYQNGQIFVFNKPLDWTSFDLVGKIRYEICKKFGIKKLKVGHAGTLDPKAEGVMILCTGKFTKRIEELQGMEKEYIADIKLGATTPSFDVETKEDETYNIEHITRELVDSALEKFVGEIEQVPPIFSAVMINGKRAYDHARKGESVEMKPKKINIRQLDILDFEKNKLLLRIVCSKGTYVRALARDLGKELGAGAYLTGLVRTRVGKYTLGESRSVDDFLCELYENSYDDNACS
ncbi:MAG: tRNA pseudouridine(55) synthase TruB [Bacteroidales bacterium]